MESCVAGLIGLSGISIRKNVNTTTGASTLSVFNKCSSGVVLYKTDNTNMDGRHDAIIFIVNENKIRVVKFNAGSDDSYQKFKISDGLLTIENTGYGLSKFTAYHIQ